MALHKFCAIVFFYKQLYGLYLYYFLYKCRCRIARE